MNVTKPTQSTSGLTTAASNNGQNGGQDMNFTALLAIIFSCTTLVIITLACALFVYRRRRKFVQNHSSGVTLTKGVTNGNANKTPNQAGVIQTERIEFVLPSYTSAEPTEEEVSEHEPGNYRYSYVHGQPSGPGLLVIPSQLRRSPSGSMIHPDTIAPALYLSSEGEEEHTTSFPPNVSLGKVGFSLKYRSDQKELILLVIGASNLPMKRAGKVISNPHIKVTILPDKHPKYFTKVLKNTTNPVYNEEFALPLRRSDAESKILQITMCDFDRFTRRIAVGHVFLPLKSLGIEDAVEPDKDVVLISEEWKSLVPKYLASDEIQGEIFLSLCYNSDNRNLRLGIHKVRNLKSETEDIVCLYAKVTLFEDGKVIKTRKTSAVKKTMEPDFAETFNIKVSRDRLQSIFCTVSVCSRNRYGSARKVIGRTQIGPYTHVSGPGADHWNDAFQSPKSTVTQWHTLR